MNNDWKDKPHFDMRYWSAKRSFETNLTQEERELSRHIEGYNEWRKQVYERDNYTCQYAKIKEL